MAGLFAVVVIHVNSYGLFGSADSLAFVASELARFAVPAFFVLSGMFWRREAIDSPLNASVGLFWKLIPLFVIWKIFYLAVDHSELLHDSTFGSSILHYLAMPVTGGAGYHLWFLPALFTGSVLCWFGLRFLGLRASMAIAIFLYAIGVFVGMVLVRMGYNIPDFIYRNGVFEAPLFLMVGYLLQLRKPAPSLSLSVLLIVLGGSLHVAEGLWRGTYPLSHDYSLGTIPFTLGMVVFFQQLKVGDRGWGRDVLGGYLIHLFLIQIVASLLPFSGPVYALVVAVAVCLLSLAASRLLKLVPHAARLVRA